MRGPAAAISRGVLSVLELDAHDTAAGRIGSRKIFGFVKAGAAGRDGGGGGAASFAGVPAESAEDDGAALSGVCTQREDAPPDEPDEAEAGAADEFGDRRRPFRFGEAIRCLECGIF